MKLKKHNRNKIDSVHFRCTRDERMAMKRKAALYSEGNLSEYIIYAALNFVPDKTDFEDEKTAGKSRRSPVSSIKPIN